MDKQQYIKSVSIILQRSDSKVLICQRSHESSFFPGFWVFPGGKVDTELPDNWEGTELEVIETLYQEMYEEVGILPGLNYTIEPNDRKKDWFLIDYDDRLRKEFKQSIVYIGHKRTPPFRKRVFDAAYYHLKGEMVDAMEPLIDGNELIDQEWILPQDAIQQWENGQKLIPPPILHLLRTLAKDPGNLEIITLIETDLPFGLQTRTEFAPGWQVVPIDSITVEPFQNTNLIIFDRGEDTLIVDPGASDEGKDHFMEMYNSLPNIPSVLITHHHQDHYNALNFLANETKALTVYAHPKTIAGIRQNIDSNNFNFVPIEDGIIEINGVDLEVIFTPGHTDSHLSLYDKEYGVLIAGDHVVGFGSAVLDEMTGDMIQYLDTCNKLLNLDLKLIIPSHGPPSFKPKDLLQQYIDHRMDRENSILNSIKQGEVNLDDIVSSVYHDVPESMWDHAKINIKHHLKKLTIEGKIPDINSLSS